MTQQAPESARKTPQQSRARATVDAIVLAAAHILKSEGPDAVTTNRIAEVAGVSIGSLYQYFANKQGILDELRARHGEWYEAETAAGIERGAAMPLREGVRASIARMLELQTLDPTLRRAITGATGELSAEDFTIFRARTVQYLRDHADQLRPSDPELTATILTRAVAAVVHAIPRDEPEWTRHPAFVDEVTQLVVGYLSPGETTARAPDTAPTAAGTAASRATR
jgi:AcrR family transcriptional regulator